MPDSTGQPPDFDAMQARMRESYEDFGRKRVATDDPGFFERVYRHGLPTARLLRLVAPLLRRKHKASGRRLLFLHARYAELLAAYYPSEAMVLGGPNDWRVARRLGMEFASTADLFLASYQILFGHRGGHASEVFAKWIEFFGRQANPCMLVVGNDTMPMALMLVTAAKAAPNVRVVCVEHGLLSAGPIYQFDDLEGRNSDVNLVFTASQRAEMERRLGDSIVEVMGLPAERRAVMIPSRPDVVLVGTGTLGDMGAYARSLALFSDVRDRAEAAGNAVVYRPHPSERGLGLAEPQFRIDRSDKSLLLVGPCKVFVGFASTLLYEADQAGHLVVVLDDPILPAYPLRDFGLPFASSELDRFASFLDAALARHSLPPVNRPSPRARFENALAAGLARLH
jgi:hypothetical protein